MAGKPNPKGARDVVWQLTALRQAQLDCERLTGGLAEVQRLLEDAKQRKVNARAEIRKLMESMDVASPGNHGYEERMLAFLLELNVAASEERINVE